LHSLYSAHLATLVPLWKQLIANIVNNIIITVVVLVQKAKT